MNFSSQIFFNDINHCYRAAILKKNSLWLLPFYMATATYFYHENVRRTMRTAIVLYLLKCGRNKDRFEALLISATYVTEAATRGVLSKKVFLEISQKFTGKHLCQSLFFNKVADLKPTTLLKKRRWPGCFPWNFMTFLRISFLQNTSGQLLLTRQKLVKYL